MLEGMVHGCEYALRSERSMYAGGDGCNGGAGGHTLCTTLYAGRVGRAGGDAPCVGHAGGDAPRVVLYAGGDGGTGGAGGNTLCTTLYAGRVERAGGDAPCAALYAGGDGGIGDA